MATFSALPENTFQFSTWEMLLAEPIYDIRPKWQKTRTRNDNNNNSSNGKLEGEKKREERRKRDETKQTKIERQTNSGTEGARLVGGRGVGVTWRRLLRNVDSAHNKK